ncbi:MAG: hypothetical protein COA32_06665 [Fluviicola sp.]|nr:MAG: hypothetical protein COA32_06665 [Fluviicola sp.]
MNSWFTIKVKYTKQLEDGRLKRVTEPYLVDAISFTDAEARIYEEVGTHVKGEFLITGISKTDYADVFYYEDAEDWYKCKLTYVSVDADSGKEKKISNNFLVTAHNVKQAYERIKESLADMTVTFEVPSIMLSPIVEVMPYNPDLDVEVGRREMTSEEREEHAEKFTEVNEPVVVDTDEQEEEEVVHVDESEAENDEDSSTFEDDTEK